MKKDITCFNPCFNGTYSLTVKDIDVKCKFNMF